MTLFLRKYLAYHTYKPIPILEKNSKNSKLGLLGSKVHLFFLKSVSWTDNELTGDDLGNCESSQLILTNLSHFL